LQPQMTFSGFHYDAAITPFRRRRYFAAIFSQPFTPPLPLPPADAIFIAAIFRRYAIIFAFMFY
jgi:hypothetical protein